MNIASIVKKEYYLDYLDGGRGIGILLVILVHVGSLLKDGDYLFEGTKSLIGFGARGVQFLFILSAFSLMNSNTIKLKFSKSKSISVIDFYKRRIQRIYPLWFLITLIAAIFSSNTSITSIVLSLSFIFGFFRYIPNTEVIVGGWAIFAELLFYLVFPYMFNRIKNLGQAIQVFILSISFSVIWRFSIPILGISGSNSFWYLFPFFHSYSFGFGILIYFLNREIITKLNLKSIYTNLMLLLSIPLYISNNYDIQMLGLFVITFTLLSKNSITNITSKSKILIQVGKLTYPIFLTHFLIIQIFENNVLSRGILNLTSFPNEIRILVWAIIITSVTFITSYMLNIFIEKPIYSRINHV